MFQRFFIIVFALLLASCGPEGGPATKAPVAPGAEAQAPADLEAPPLQASPAKPGEFRVALLLPLTGQNADVGKAFLEAAQMALFDIGQPGLILLPRDVGDTPEKAAEAAKAAIADGAQLVLGPVFSQSVAAAGAVARERHIALIGFSNNRSVAGDGIFLTGLTPLEEVRRVIRYAISQGHMSLAALIPETPYGDAVAAAFRDTVQEDGAEVSRMVTYKPQRDALFDPVKDLADYDVRRKALEDEVADLKRFGKDDDLAQEMLDRLKNVETLGDLPFDALLVPEGGSLLRALGPLLPYYEIDPAKVKFLGTDLWDDPALTLEPPLYGAWFAAPPDDARTGFEKRFRGLYGDPPPRIASLAYDAVALAAGLGLPRSNQLKGKPLPEDLLLNKNGFRGLDGIFRFTPDGLTQRGLAVKEIRPDGIVTISPAPTTFQIQGF